MQHVVISTAVDMHVGQSEVFLFIDHIIKIYII